MILLLKKFFEISSVRIIVNKIEQYLNVMRKEGLTMFELLEHQYLEYVSCSKVSKSPIF
jgi:hypothetical protein